MTIARIQSGSLGLAAAVGAAGVRSGCPGTLDPSLLASGSGGNSGGSIGSGGSRSGGSTADCTGNNDVNYIVMGTGNSDCSLTAVGPRCNACAQAGCHVPDGGNVKSASISGRLDLTVDADVGSRLIGVFSGTSANGSFCTADGKNYLDARMNPPTSLLIDKIKAKPLCGDRMPYPGVAPLSSTQITCVQAWAEGLIMAAPGRRHDRPAVRRADPIWSFLFADGGRR